MIRIRIDRQKQQYRSLTARGHAVFSDEGSDIVCAAVSALMINTANSLEQFTDDGIVIEEGGAQEGYLKIEFTERPSSKGKLLMDSLILGLEMIRQEYGEAFVMLEDDE